jgi:hypothetical protein
MIFLLPFVIGIAIAESIEYAHILGAGNAPIVAGDIIRRAWFQRWGGIPGAELTIKLVEQDVTVIAHTNKDDMQNLPQRVRFQYTGDPGREVFIEGEEHPLWIALFLWTVSAGIVLLCIVPLFRRANPDPDGSEPADSAPA